MPLEVQPVSEADTIAGDASQPIDVTIPEPIVELRRGVEPRNFHEGSKEAGWRAGMQQKLDALEANGTWIMEPLPSGKKVEEIDYGKTFSPVAKMVTVHAFLAVAVIQKWKLHQMDVHNAFLHDDLDEEVFMKLSPGFLNGILVWCAA
ncbi:hypothetical protein LIER_15947 [Lithospermum erythrorhizon]|uniref:Reverse transcriptase Ty1/copia-type domain-containing protein n=1 Tax=Lithospermum erythrorhizon TaxID=34254 RepID=A0AAV3Q7D3_LITER